MDLLKILDTKPDPSIVDAQTLGATGNVSGDYWLPTTMCLYQKELTDQIVSLHYSDILRYFETSDYKEDVVLESMRTMCTNSAFVATHPYLLIDHYMPKSLITRDIPAHLAETSGKFTVLRDLMNLVQKYETNTAIVCRPGRTMDLVEALLLGNKVNIKRHDSASIKSKQKRPRTYSCTCHLFSSEAPSGKGRTTIDAKERFDMVVSVDPSVDTESTYVQRIIRHARPNKGGDSHAPIVRLVAIDSVDHCSLFFGKNYKPSSTEYLARVTAGVVVLRDRVGTLPPDLRPIYSQHLSYLVDWLEDSSLPWPLPDVYPIKEYNQMDVERSLLSEVKFNQVEDLDAIFNENSRKRGRHKDRHEDGSNYGESVSYYQLKRLKNDYATNPTKQGMKELTGITAAGEEDSINYHLVSGILTHKLIQSIGQVYLDIEGQVREIADYDAVNSIEKEHVQFFMKECESVHSKFKTSKELIAKLENDAKNAEETSNTHYDLIRTAEEKYTAALANLSVEVELEGKLKELITEKNSLLEDLEREERQTESKAKEKVYMSKEIERADTAMKTSSEEIVTLKKESEEIQVKIRKTFEENTFEEENVNDRMKWMRSELKNEEKAHDELEASLTDLIERLHKVPTSRARTSSTTKGKGRRK